MSTQNVARTRPILIVCLVAAMAAAGSSVLAETPGRALVEMNCARCHAIDRDDASRHPEAPAFRDLHNRYPLDALEEAFVEGISVGHPDMPQFVASPLQIEAIIEYIETLAP